MRPGDVGQADVDLAVEATGPEDRGVEDVEPVRRGDDDDVVGRAEAVELDEQLVERLLPLLVAVRAAAGLAHRVELVEEDDAAAELAGLREQVADAPARPTPTYFSTNSEPDAWWNGTPASAATARASIVLPVPGGPYSMIPRGIRAPSLWKRSGEPQELDRLGQLELGLVAAGDVLEADDPGRDRVGDLRHFPSAGGGAGMIVLKLELSRWAALFRREMRRTSARVTISIVNGRMIAEWVRGSVRPARLGRGECLRRQEVAVAERLQRGDRLARRDREVDRNDLASRRADEQRLLGLTHGIGRCVAVIAQTSPASTCR